MKNSCSGIKEDWCLWAQTCRPVRAKALKYLAIYKAFALTGRLADCYYTQGDALG